MSSSSSSSRARFDSLGMLVALIVSLVLVSAASLWRTGEVQRSRCRIHIDDYKGPVYTTAETISNEKCLVSSNWMQVTQHTVKTPSDGVIDDWLFVDYHDRVNVLAELKGGGDIHSGQRFQVFRQRKYALEGKSSLAVVGGIIEPGESAEAAAKRELDEELHLVSDNMVFLGRFRTDVNRGMGWVNAFLAKDCVSSAGLKATNRDHMQVGAADEEYQRPLRLTFSQLRAEVARGSFTEVQWSNTVALAVLHLLDPGQ